MAYQEFKNIDEYKDFCGKFKRKETCSNNYMLPDEVNELIIQHRLFYHSSEHNAFVLVEKDTCLRIYYYINEWSEPILFSADFSYAIEILYRGEKFYPEKEIAYWGNNGFSLHLVRDFYTARYADMQLPQLNIDDVVVKQAATLEDVLYAIRLFNSSFDSYTGDYIDESLASRLLEEQNIVIAYCKGIRKGACHFYEKSKVVYLGHLSVEADARGKKMGALLMNALINLTATDDKSRYALWVQHQNENAIKLYQHIGYKYANKSTVSLLKLK